MEGEEKEGGILTMAGPELRECLWAQDGWEAVTGCSPDVERALLPAALSCSSPRGKIQLCRTCMELCGCSSEPSGASIPASPGELHL